MTANQETSLRERCAELAEWWDTGLLRDGRLRELAATLERHYEDERLRAAERQTEQEAVRAVAARAEPQAGAWVLVPREVLVEAAEWEAATFIIGSSADGFCDATLVVGAATDDDGREVFGLHVRSEDYPEEGCVTLAEFAAAPSPASRARPEAQGEMDIQEHGSASGGAGDGRASGSTPQAQGYAKGFDSPRSHLTTPPADRAPGEATVLEVAFKYENGVNVPTVLVGFAPEDWATRDRFAASLIHQEPAR